MTMSCTDDETERVTKTSKVSKVSIMSKVSESKWGRFVHRKLVRLFHRKWVGFFHRKRPNPIDVEYSHENKKDAGRPYESFPGSSAPRSLF